MNATLSPEGLTRGESLSPGPKLNGRIPGPRPRSLDAPAEMGGMASHSRTLLEGGPQLASDGTRPVKVSATKTDVAVSLHLLECIVGGAEDGGFGESDVERGTLTYLAADDELAAMQVHDLLADGESEPAP